MKNESKESLELQKLKAELKQLELNWWKNPEYISAIASIIVPIFGALATVLTAYIGGLVTVVENKRTEVEKLAVDKNNLNENISESRNDLLALQAEKATANQETQANQNLIIFSTDPSLSIQASFSAEFEVQIAKDKLQKEAIVFQRNNLYSTGIQFDTEQNAQKQLPNIQKRLQRPSAFITSVESFCSEPRTQEKTSIGGGANYPYILYKCGTSNP